MNHASPSRPEVNGPAESAGEPCDRLYAREATERIRLGGSACRCGLWYLGEAAQQHEPMPRPIATTKPESAPAQHNRAA